MLIFVGFFFCFVFCFVVEALDCWVNLKVRRLEFNMKKIL